MSLILYHGTNSKALEKILKHGFDPSCATHEKKYLEKIWAGIDDLVVPSEDLKTIRCRISGRVTASEVWGSKLSFVDDFGIARVWALENPYGSEQTDCLAKCYELIFEKLPKQEQNRWALELLVDRINPLRQQANGSYPVVITVKVCDDIVKEEGMEFTVPIDGTMFDTLGEYDQCVTKASSEFTKQIDFDKLHSMAYDEKEKYIEQISVKFKGCMEYRTTQALPKEYIVKHERVGEQKVFEPLIMPKLID